MALDDQTGTADAVVWPYGLPAVTGAVDALIECARSIARRDADHAVGVLLLGLVKLRDGLEAHWPLPASGGAELLGVRDLSLYTVRNVEDGYGELANAVYVLMWLVNGHPAALPDLWRRISDIHNPPEPRGSL